MMGAAAAPRPAAPLLSPNWFRVAGLHPRLLREAGIERQVVRGEVWHVLQRPDGLRSFRLDAAAWAVLGRCDGRHTVQAVWNAALATQGDAAPTQDELLDMLARLHAAGLLSFDRAPDFGATGPAPPDELEAQREGARRNTLLAWRVPLGEPDAALARWSPRLAWLFTPAAALAGLALVVSALLAAWPRAAELQAWLAQALASPRVWLMGLLLYPLVKLLHELAHGLAARHFGARVPQWGVALLMFMPVPYVDASAASALPRRRHRLVVAGAGIAVELGLAALAVHAALALQPGLLRDAALVVFFIGALSTLLVNANPLMRFDGYHMACDALGLPNLATRSTRHWLQMLRRRLLGLGGEPALRAAPGEAGWLWLYAPLALLMRVAVALAVLAWLAAQSLPLAVVVGAVLAWSLAGAPLRRLWRWWHGPALADAERGPAGRRLLVVALAGLLPLAVLPAPDVTVAQGLLWLPERALVRAQTEGRIEQVLVEDGQAVAAGEPLLVLHAADLQARESALLGRLQALQAEQALTLRSDPGRAVAAAHALQSAQAELDQLQQELAGLVVRAPVAGRLALPQAVDLPGRHVGRGTLLAHVITEDPGLVQVAVPHEHAARITAAVAVSLRRADPTAPPLHGRWSGSPSGAVDRLPGAALAERHGGPVATDPADAAALKPAQPVVVGEVRLEGEPLARIGERVWVRFEHGHAPLAWQALRALQQQLLRHLAAEL